VGRVAASIWHEAVAVVNKRAVCQRATLIERCDLLITVREEAQVQPGMVLTRHPAGSGGE